MCIVLGTDGSDASLRATEVACELARATEDELLIVSAWPELRSDVSPSLRRLLVELLESQRDVAEEILAGASRFASSQGVAAETLSRSGDAVAAICAAAEERGACLIVVGSRGSGVGSAGYRSVSRRVLRHAPCPVLVVPTHAA
jgi:nucleotide-binding universal stress UspA family protein